MSHFDGEQDDSWDGWGRAPTARQIAYIEDLCEELGLDCRTILPDNFEEASELIDELKDELGWDD